MRAIVFRSADAPVEFTEVELAPPGPSEVRVAIAAAGVCHSDLHVRRGEWTAPTPLVMGHEGSGVVTEIGSEVTTLRVGDHVVLSWVPACGRCRACLRGREAQCLGAAEVAASGTLFDGTSRLRAGGERLFHYLGVSSYAEEVVVPESGAIRIRRDAPLETVAIVGCAVATGIGAVTNTAQVEAGSSVVVVGCGGVGLNVVQGARLAGAERIVAVDVRAEKLQVATALGATDVLLVDAATDPVDALRELLPDGADYVFDAIGRIETTEQAIRMLALGGAAVIVGLPPAGAVARFDPLALAEADQRILGSNYGSVRARIDIPDLVERYMDGVIELDRLISSRRPLSEAIDALDELQSGSALRTLLVP